MGDVVDMSEHPQAPDPDGVAYRVMERKLAEAEAELARLRDPAGDELPDDLRAPLHSLQADREYLVARIRKADDEEAGLLNESIRNRLSQIEEAAYRLNGRLRAPVEGEVGEMVKRLEDPRFDGPLNKSAADLLQRLAGQVEELKREFNENAEQLEQGIADQHALYAETEARLREAVEVILEFSDAAQVDVLMDGPRLAGWNRSALNRAFQKLRAFLAKLEKTDA